jgi:predicted ATPase/class 3 adenylate cyclase
VHDVSRDLGQEQRQLEAAIDELQGRRALLGDAATELIVGTLRDRLAVLDAGAVGLPPAQALKQVSVLFLDICGSTALSQRLDPEEVHAVIDGVLTGCTAIVGAHGGKVLQYAGDSLLAVFGAEGAQEDDAERAVRAGLQLLEEGRRHAELVRAKYAHEGFAVRAGVHTGGVLLGGGVEADHSIRGMTVHVAARMEQTAPPGALRISHATYRHVRGVFDVVAQPPLAIKGVAEPVATYLVQRARPRAFKVATRGIEGVETRMVGREAELQLLQDAFMRLYRPGASLTLVTVVGEAGVGKSRLLYEFENWADACVEEFYVMRGRAEPQTQGRPYGLLRDILGWRFQILDVDAIDVARRKLEAGVVALFEPVDGLELAQAYAHLLGHLIGLDFSGSRHVQAIQDDGRQIRNRAFHALALMIRRASDRNRVPVVLMLEDLHWADEGSLEFIDYLIDVDGDVPLLLFGLTRPMLFERRPQYGGPAEQHRIDLAPLDRGHSRALANELLKKLGEVPGVLRELLIGGSEGNPFYMEELVKMLIDEGAIATDCEPWRLDAGKLLAAHVPPTLTGVLQARLDGLAASERLALQQAAVIGHVFWDQALAFVDAHAVAALPALMRRELIIARATAPFEGAHEYTFKHHLLHQVTYETVLKRDRRIYHARVATWLADSKEVRAGDFLGAIAEHFDKAGDTRQACEYFTRAAESAATGFAHEALLHYVSRALEQIADDDRETRWRLLSVREHTLNLRGARDEQAADVQAMERLAEALGDDRRRAEAAWRRCDLAMRVGDMSTAQAAARRAMELGLRTGALELALRAQARLSRALAYEGEPEGAKALAQEGLSIARAKGLRAEEARFLIALGIVADLQGDVLGDLEANRQALMIHRTEGDREGEAIAGSNVGGVLMGFGAFAEARSYLQESLQLMRMVGNRQGESFVLITMSELALREGDAALALGRARAALDIALASYDPEGQCFAWMRLAEAELALGHGEAAAQAFDKVRASQRAAGNEDLAIQAAAGLARMALAQGDSARAMAYADEIVAFLARHGGYDGTGRFAPGLAAIQVLQGASDARASSMLAAAHSALQAKAASIGDAILRERFLTRIAEHRDIVAAWSADQVTR